jgi:o-succinylbenzoate---CoA ligase
MVLFDFENGTWPSQTTEPYMQKVLAFVAAWQAGCSSFLQQTSGSTGTAKTIKIQRKQMIASALLTGQTLNLAKGTIALCCMNIDFIAGKMMLARAMTLGWKIWVITPKLNPFEELENGFIFDFTALAPIQLQAVLANKNTAKYLWQYSGAKKILVGGAAVDNLLKSQIQQSNILFYETYGMTETISHVALKLLNGPMATEHFFPLKGIVLAQDKRGCLKIKHKITNHKWLQTNDIAEFYEDGSFDITGRTHRVINSGGIKIQLEEIEAEIQNIFLNSMQETPKIVALGQEDSTFGQKLVLILEAEEIPENFESILTKNWPFDKKKLPKKYYNLTSFPLLANGKTDLQEIKNWLNQIAT